MTPDAMRQVLRDAVKQYGGQSAWGRKYGISPTTINLALHGKAPISPAMAEALGYERIRRSDYVFTPLPKDGIEKRMEIERSREDDGDE